MKFIFSKLLAILIIIFNCCLPNVGTTQVNCPGSWSTKTSMTDVRAYATAGIINDKMYVVGGTNGNGAHSSLEAYDPLTNTWSDKASMSINRAALRAGVINNKLYVVGGCIGSDCRIGTTNILEVYDPVSNSWQTKTSMPTARSNMATGVIGNKLYVAGGNQQCGPCSPLSVVEVYDAITDTWTTLAPLPVPVTHTSGGVINGKFYVVGGSFDGGIQFSQALQEYDPVLNTWVLKTPMPTARNLAGTGVINNQLYVISGQNAITQPDVVEVYDPPTNTWSSKAPIPTPRNSLSIGVINDILYAAGGASNNGFHATVEAFSLDLTPPVITCPANVTNNCQDNHSPAATGQATATDNCDPGPVVIHTDVSTHNLDPANVNHYNYTITRTWKATDAAGNFSTCVQTITVQDVTAPVISCSPNVQQCFDASGVYNIPQVAVNDNCAVNSVSYQLTGATSRSGSGTNASGSFNSGVTQIIRTVTDRSGNSSTCQTTVTINPQLLISIPVAYAVSPGGGDNTIYIGYGETSLTLNANVSGGTAPYTYSWSTGQTSSSISVGPSTVGNHTYSVTVTDAAGCSVTLSRDVTVMDVRCGNDKIYMCHIPSNDPTHEVTICISPNAVAAHFVQGCKLGQCIAGIMVMTNVMMEQNITEGLILKAMPNPSSNYFTLKIESDNNEQKIRLRVLDIQGRLVEEKNNLSAHQTLQLGQNYLPGLFIAEIIQGNRRRVVKLVKL